MAPVRKDNQESFLGVVKSAKTGPVPELYGCLSWKNKCIDFCVFDDFFICMLEVGLDA